MCQFNRVCRFIFWHIASALAPPVAVLLLTEVVKASLREDGGAGLEPDGLLDGEGVLQELGHDAAQGAEHGPAGVDDLDGPVPLEGLWVSREASGVLHGIQDIYTLAKTESSSKGGCTPCSDAGDMAATDQRGR